ncbi:antitoxin VapB family protein [Halorussus salilacus]|uniref:antitoxin VapB family protein n=1 Tax=Halorussus salilacus TaxID=2953750 RepID=UPI00209CEEFA|nr:antitoxin VapB family protein [Halorussus salilacus]USZ66959.1 antitoxin VapB family protein [Halorussus salilacus]
MGTADKHVRVSEENYERLKARRREDETFDDVVERLLADDRDLLAGFGAWEETDQRGVVEELHEQGKRESADRVEEIARHRSDE